MISKLTNEQVASAHRVLSEVAHAICREGLIDEAAAVLGAAQVLAIVGADRRELMTPPPAPPPEEQKPTETTP